MCSTCKVGHALSFPFSLVTCFFKGGETIKHNAKIYWIVSVLGVYHSMRSLFSDLSACSSDEGRTLVTSKDLLFSDLSCRKTSYQVPLSKYSGTSL